MKIVEGEHSVSLFRVVVLVCLFYVALFVMIYVGVYDFAKPFVSECGGCGFPSCGNGTVLGDPCMKFIEMQNSLNPYCWVLDGNATVCEWLPLSKGKSFNVTYWVNGSRVSLTCEWSVVTKSYWWWLRVNGSLVASCMYGDEGCCYICNQSLIKYLP